MGKQIIKQSDGKYCIWSTIVDDILFYDMTKKEVYDHFKQCAIKDAIAMIDKSFDNLERGSIDLNPYKISLERAHQRIQFYENKRRHET